jgi:hypothetical protein
MRGHPMYAGIGIDDRDKILAMKKRLNPDGTRRYSNEEIAAYTGFPVAQVCYMTPRAFTRESGRPSAVMDNAEPLSPTDLIYFRDRTKRSSDKLLAALQRAMA